MDFEWNLSPQAAVAAQKKLAEEVKIMPLKKSPRLVGGADISFNKYSPRMYAGIVVLKSDTMEIVDKAAAVLDVAFPYIPGLLSFREIPPLLLAWERLSKKPDLVVCDGHGIAHPRRLGIASHFGLVTAKPTLGCAKSALVGKFQEPAQKAGSTSKLIHKEEVVGAALRTKDKVKPVFVSPGHLIDLESSVKLLLSFCRGYRIPEPTRQAHLFVNEVRRADLGMPAA